MSGDRRIASGDAYNVIPQTATLAAHLLPEWAIEQLSSRIGRRKRLVKAAATCARSEAMPVSRSTIEASVTNCSGVVAGMVGSRLAQISASA